MSATTEKDPKLLWMVKPCEFYKEELKDCRRFAARFHQYFVHGEFSDCSIWKKDLNNCHKWEDSNDRDAVNEIIESEKKRVRDRLQGHYDNDVWESRKTPLTEKEWNPPLPQNILKGYENSFLQQKADAIKNGSEKLGGVEENIRNAGIIDTEAASVTSMCSIM